MDADLSGLRQALPEPAPVPGAGDPPHLERQARPAPRPTERLTALLEVVLVSGLPSQLVVMVGLAALGIAQTGAGGTLSREFVFALLLSDTALVLVLIAAFLHARRDSWRDVLLGGRRQPPELVLGFACVPLVLVGVAGTLAGIRTVLPGLHNVPANPFEPFVQTGHDAVLMGALAVLSGGVKEEIQRAFVLRRFGQFLGGERVGLVVFSLAFGAGHFVQGWDVGIVTTLLGAFWGILYLWRRSISASVINHSGFNVAQIVQFLVAGS
ncbi:MAG: type II CAAX endopeptidase family protein [Acidobacteriota bacterium]